MFSKRELEGYLMSDHRESPGFTPGQAVIPGCDALPIGPGALFEAPTVNCSHCERLVVINPNRTRSRGYCPKCDHYVCDECEAARVKTGICRPFKQVIDEWWDEVSKNVR